MRKDIQKLVSRGFAHEREDGTPTVPVMLHYTQSVDGKDRKARKAFLVEKFARVLQAVGASATLDLASVSPSANSVRGEIDAEAFELVERTLNSQEVQVNLDLPAQAAI